MLGTGILFIGVLVVGAFVVSIITRLFKRGDGDSKAPVARGVTLNCPHCGRTTEAAKHQCQHCSQDL